MNKASIVNIVDFMYTVFDLLNLIIEVFRNLGEFLNRN